MSEKVPCPYCGSHRDAYHVLVCPERVKSAAPPATRKQRTWLNVYENGGRLYLNGTMLSRRDADVAAYGDRVACIAVDLEEGRFDPA